MTAGNRKILDEIRKEQCQGKIEVTIPRDSRSNIPERKAVLQMRYASYQVKRPHILNPVKTLPDSIALQVIYAKEERLQKGKEPIERFLMTGEPVNSAEEAYKYAGYYIQNMTYIGRLMPELPCSLVLGEDEWKLLYCAANKTKGSASPALSPVMGGPTSVRVSSSALASFFACRL